MRAYLKGLVAAIALLAAGVVVSPSAQTQVSIGRATVFSWISSTAARISANDNHYTVTLADWGTTESAETISVAVDGVVFLGAGPIGYLTINNITDRYNARFELLGNRNDTNEITDIGGLFSKTKDNASTTNIYYDAAGASGAGYYVQNKRSGTISLRLMLLGG